jgi:O-antigen chain-terminating methyltransferase
MSDNFYRAFEDRYRGSHELIKQRLHAYDPFTLPLAQLYPGGQVLDLGCGRGEWLELMSEAGFAARGVDLDEGMLEASRARGLDVELAEALETLRALPDATMALVSAFHLVEHLPFDQVQQVIREARRVLLPGGLLILETPNPENLIIGTTNFYLDPSHLRPLPPMLLAFTVEYQGFARHATVRLQEGAALKDIDAIGMTELLEGVSPDYSIVAQNLAPATIAQHFDAAFEADYGISLLVMAQQFDQQQDAVVAALRGAIAAAGASAPAYPPEQVAALVQQATAQDSAIAGTDRALRAIGADLTGRIEAVDAQGHARLQLAVDAIGTQLTALVQQATLQDAGIANTDLALRTIAASLDQRINEVQSATDAKLQSEVDIMGNRLADLAGGAERARVALEARLEAIEASIANVESQADRRVSTLEERRKDNEALDYERAAAFDQRLAPVALRL